MPGGPFALVRHLEGMVWCFRFWRFSVARSRAIPLILGGPTLFAGYVNTAPPEYADFDLDDFHEFNTAVTGP